MPPSPGHFCANSVTAAPCGQKKQERANNHSQSVIGPEADTAGIRFRLATATTKSNTRSRRPRTRSRPGFFFPSPMGLTVGRSFPGFVILLPIQVERVPWVGCRPSFSSHVRPRERGAPVKSGLTLRPGRAGEASRRAAGPALEGSRKHGRLRVADDVGNRGDRGRTVLHQGLGDGRGPGGGKWFAPRQDGAERSGTRGQAPGNCRETQGAQAKSLGDEIVDLTGETFRFPCSPAPDRADAFPQLP